MTIRELINECSAYEHSKEHYEIMKENAELDLMSQMISDQQFISESAEEEFFKSLNSTGFFAEATSEDTNSATKKTFREKLGTLLGKLVGGIVKLGKMIAGFFVKIFNKIKDKFSKKDVVEDDFDDFEVDLDDYTEEDFGESAITEAATPASKALVKELVDIYNASIFGANVGCRLYAGEFKNAVPKSIKSKADLKKLFAATKGIVAKDMLCGTFYGSKLSNAMECTDIVDLMEELGGLFKSDSIHILSSKTIDIKIDNAERMLKRQHSTTGFGIDTKNIDREIENSKKMVEIFNSISSEQQKQMVEMSSGMLSDKSREKLTNIYTKLNAVIPATVEYYTGVAKFIDDVNAWSKKMKSARKSK